MIGQCVVHHLRDERLGDRGADVRAGSGDRMVENAGIARPVTPTEGAPVRLADSISDDAGRLERELALNIYSGEPMLLRTLFVKRVPASRLLALPAVVVPLMMLAAGTGGELTTSGLVSLWCHDFAHLALLESRLACADIAAPSTSFPLFRDWPVLIVAIILSLTPYLLFRQWAALERFVPSLLHFKCIVFPDPASRTAYEKEVERANRFYVRAGDRGALYAAIGFVSVLLVTVAAARSGIYERFAPDGLTANEVRAWARESYDQWWATYDNWPGWLCYVVVGSVGIYTIVLQDVMGWRAVYFMWRTRDLVEYRANWGNPDGFYGWGEGRRVIAFTYASVVVHGFALAMIGVSLPLNAAVFFMGPLLLCWALTVPFCVFIPCHIVRRKVREYKERERRRLAGRISDLDHEGSLSSDQILTREALINDRERLENIKDLPIKRRRDTPFVTLTFLASLASIYGAIALIWGGGQ